MLTENKLKKYLLSNINTSKIPKNELFSSISHLFGIILSIIGTTILITISALKKKDFTYTCIFYLRIFNDSIIFNEHSLPHISKRK